MKALLGHERVDSTLRARLDLFATTPGGRAVLERGQDADLRFAAESDSLPIVAAVEGNRIRRVGR
jgi:hypothetical protein